MPHFTLEYSSNISEKDNLKSLFEECHIVLAKMLPADINACKSKGIEYQNYYVGNGNAANAFVHGILNVMPGRSAETLKNASEAILLILKNHFKKSLHELQLQITVETNEFLYYSKITS